MADRPASRAGRRGRAFPRRPIIIEYLAVHIPGRCRLIPDEPDAALDVRLMDRFFDNYVSTPQGPIVFDANPPEGEHDPYGVEQSRAMLDKAYAWLDARMAGRTGRGDAFSLADCAAAPALLYADWTHPIPEGSRTSGPTAGGCFLRPPTPGPG